MRRLHMKPFKGSLELDQTALHSGDVSMSKCGGKGGRRHYECHEELHIGPECPIRKDRVSRGSPERMPKGKGKGKGMLAWKQGEGSFR